MTSNLDRHAEQLSALGHPARLCRTEGTALRTLTDYLREDCCKRGKSGCC